MLYLREVGCLPPAFVTFLRALGKFWRSRVETDGCVTMVPNKGNGNSLDRNGQWIEGAGATLANCAGSGLGFMNFELTQHANSGGFSLAELLTAMGLTAVLLAIAAPQLPTYYAQLEIAGGAKQVAIDLHRARMKAVGENAFYRLTFSDDGTYVRQSSQDGATFVNDGAAVALPTGVQFVGTLPQPTFNRLGTVAADATVTLTNVIGTTKAVHVNTLGNITIS